MTKQEAINKVINIAKAEVGYLEKTSNAGLDSKTDNAGYKNYTKYWRDIKPEYQGEPWCACFVTWVLEQAFGKLLAKQLLRHYPYVYCPEMAGLFTLNANPKVGDIVIFKRNGTFVHTGIVTYVDGDYFKTVEGNTSGGSTIISNGGGVFEKSYYNSNLPGTKFCTPDYSIIKDTEELTMTQYNELKNMIEEMRSDIDGVVQAIGGTFIYNYNDKNVPDWARDALGAAIKCGAIKGNEKGELGLNFADLRNIVREYRRGLYDEKK